MSASFLEIHETSWQYDSRHTDLRRCWIALTSETEYLEKSSSGLGVSTPKDCFEDEGNAGVKAAEGYDADGSPLV